MFGEVRLCPKQQRSQAGNHAMNNFDEALAVDEPDARDDVDCRQSELAERSPRIRAQLRVLLGDDVVTAEPGTWVFKPRGQWHTFWNAGDTPCEIIEVISPGGFEDYFRELRAIWPDRTKAAPLLQKYELDMDFDSVPDLCARFGLT